MNTDNYNEGEYAVLKKMRTIHCICLFFLAAVFAAAQDQGGQFRGSIPEELLRPRWGESARFPSDTVIGELGQGGVSAAAFNFASTLAAGFLSVQMNHPALASINSVIRESYLSAIDNVEPVSYRMGSGRDEADGAVSFLIRFIGNDYAITGELFVRYVTRQVQGADDEITTVGSWVFEDLLLEEPRSREVENLESPQHQRFDFLPYERYF